MSVGARRRSCKKKFSHFQLRCSRRDRPRAYRSHVGCAELASRPWLGLHLSLRRPILEQQYRRDNTVGSFSERPSRSRPSRLPGKPEDLAASGSRRDVEGRRAGSRSQPDQDRRAILLLGAWDRRSDPDCVGESGNARDQSTHILSSRAPLAFPVPKLLGRSASPVARVVLVSRLLEESRSAEDLNIRPSDDRYYPRCVERIGDHDAHGSGYFPACGDHSPWGNFGRHARNRGRRSCNLQCLRFEWYGGQCDRD
jgi:hypothetical protein